MADSYPFIEAALGRPTTTVPVWMMRQAGRYMPEYRAIKERYSFIDMIQTPELATAITLQPIDAFGMDAAILFSDILVTATAMGCRFDYIEGRGPIFADPIRTTAQIEILEDTALDRLSFVSNAIQMLLPELSRRHTPLIGFAGAPFTVAAFMIAGHSPNPFSEVREWLQAHPKASHLLLEKLATITGHYLNMQIHAGVHAVQIFDTLLDQLSDAEFEQWAWPYLKRVVEMIQAPNDLPVIVFSKATERFWRYFIQLAIQVISVDAASDMGSIARQVPSNIAIQGNLDPTLLVNPPDDLQNRVEAIIRQMRPRPGYIFNLGHGVLKETNPAVVKQIVEWVHAQ